MSITCFSYYQRNIKLKTLSISNLLKPSWLLPVESAIPSVLKISYGEINSLPGIFLLSFSQVYSPFVCLNINYFLVALDPLILTVATWLIKGMGSKKERCKSACKKGLIFGTLLTLAHFICSRDSYSTLINLRRKIPFNTSNVMTFSVGIRLLNCLSFILLLAFELIKENMNNVSPILVKDNFVKNKPVKRDSECSISTQASSDEDSYSISSLMVEKTKSD